MREGTRQFLLAIKLLFIKGYYDPRTGDVLPCIGLHAALSYMYSS